MSLHISSSTISKLAHDIPEIRSRALKHVDEKLRRALELDHELIFSPGNLIKHLIRWFGQKPLYEEETVLKIIKAILQSKYGNEAVHYLTKARLLKEFKKVDIIVQSERSKNLLYEIVDLISEHETPEDTCSMNKSGQTQDSQSSISSCSDIMLDDTSDYEVPWSLPSPPDYNSLKLLSESLKSESEEDLQHAFNYLDAAINDYPAEYFLQPPYIFNSLLLLAKKSHVKSDKIINVLINLTKSLAGRIKKKQLAVTHHVTTVDKCNVSNTQITPHRYSIVLFNICIDYYKKSSEEENSPPPPLIYILQDEILELIASDLRLYDFRNTILIDLGNLARYYRRLYSIVANPSNNLNRMLHVYLLKLIIGILNIEVKKQIQLIPTGEVKKPNYDPENYMSTSTSTTHETEQLGVWMSELECAVFDFPLKQMCPELYNQIKMYSKVSEKSKLQLLLNCEEYLAPAIDIVKRHDDISSETFVQQGFKVLDALLLTKNIEIIKDLIDAIVECIPKYDGDPKLRESAENLLLRLLSHEHIRIKRTVYKTCSNIVKQFFAEAMNGEVIFIGLSFGIPLASNIISEIIFNGYLSKDECVKVNAETILLLILKARPILDDKWHDMLDILLPNFPLLQSVDSSGKSNLSDLLVKLYHPQDKQSGLSLLEQLKGNLRFLFSKDEASRQNALSGIIYMISTQTNAKNLIPNVLQISDTIGNDVCVVDTPRQSSKMFIHGLYEVINAMIPFNIRKSTVLALVELLRSPDVEPAIRKTTLLQLNVMCQDPDLVDLIHDHDGWSLALQALNNALKKHGSIDYPDAVIPATGILCKIALCRFDFRRKLSDEIEVYFLLMRALFAFPYEDIFKQDCIVLLFVLSFSSILIGNKNLSIPEICQGLFMPLECKLIHGSSESPKCGMFEQAYAELFAGVIDSPRSNHSTDFHLDMSRLNDNVTTSRECTLRFIRLQLAILWCEGYDNVLTESFNKNNDGKYSTVSPTISTKNENLSLCSLQEFLKYNPELLLQSCDIESIRISSAEENLKQFLYDVENAITHSQVLKSISQIQLCASIFGKLSNHQQKNILNTFKRYLMTLPNNSKDIALFNSIVRLLTNLIVAGNEDTLFLILAEFKSKHCMFLNILINPETCIWLYKVNCKFLQTIIKQCVYHSDQKEIKSYMVPEKSGDKINLYNRLFENALKIAEECFQRRDVDRFRTLLNLIQFLSSSGSTDLDEGFVMTIIRQMIDYIVKLKSFTQTGSHIIKNALLVGRNIAEDVNDVILDEKYLKCLSGLGAHQDFEVRAQSWCLFEKISSSLKGAHSLVKALSYLPGGFHSCCLSTLMGKAETPIVRATAGAVLSNLLSYTKDTSNGKTINISVAPLHSNQELSTANDGIQLLLQLFQKYRFYEHISESLDVFYLSDIILTNGKDSITTCGIVKVYCSILINFTEIHPELLQHYFDYSCFEKMFKIVKNIQMCITDSSLDMLSEICHLLTKFLWADERVAVSLVSRDLGYIKALVDVLDWSFYEKTTGPSPLHTLQMLRILAKESAANNMILNTISNDDSKKFFVFVYHALHCKNILIRRSVLDLIHTLLNKDQVESYDTPYFVDILDSIEIIDLANSTYSNGKKAKLGCKTVKGKYASEEMFLILQTIHSGFESGANSRHNCENQKLLSSCCDTLALLLKCSSRARLIASHVDYFDYLMARLGKIFEEMRMSCTDFIRKYGDAKKLPIIDEFILIFEIILNWYYEDSLVDDNHINQLTKMLVNIWPWINHSAELRLVFINVLAFLSENSIGVCKQFSTTVSGQSATILQQLIALLVHETTKVKSLQIDTILMETGIRTISNCCSCIEGRLQCIKFNVLNIFDKFHPSITKSQKFWTPIILLWLNYWEIFSRYPEGATVRHMHLLGILISKSSKNIRYKCLEILRNMTFLNSNRAALCSSEDFLYIAKSVLSDGSVDEQMIILVAIWRLVAGNCKSKQAIKSTSIPKKINLLHSEMLKSYCSEEESDVLLNVLEILNKILC